MAVITEKHIEGLLPLAAGAQPLSVPTADSDESLRIPRDERSTEEGSLDTVVSGELLVSVAPLFTAQYY